MTNTQSLKERRAFPRIPAVFPARVSSSIIGETVNLSETGLCLALEKPLVSSVIISVNIDLPFSSPIGTQAEVIWTSSSIKENRFKCGVRFLKLKEDELNALREVLLKHNILDENLVFLTKDIRFFLQEVKRKFDVFDDVKPSERKQIKFIEANKNRVYDTLTDHFTKAWGIMKNLTEEDFMIHQRYYQKMLGFLLLDIIETNRYIVEKPLGYAGDYITMNYIYDYSPPERYLGNSSFEKLINHYTCNIPISRSNIKRKDFFKQKILDTVHQKNPAKILSVGSGPARELVELLKEGRITKPLKFDCLDFEKRALDYLHNEIDKIDLKKRIHLSIKYINKNLMDVVKNKFSDSDGRDYDLIYCSGVFDYLRSRIAKRLVGTLYKLLKKNGSLIIVNADIDNSSHRAYYEILGDWKFKHRTRQELLDWVKDIEDLKDVNFEEFKQGNSYLFLHIKRH